MSDEIDTEYTYTAICSCGYMLQAPTVEQIERARVDHVRAEHPDRLPEIEGQLLQPVKLLTIDQQPDGSWIITCLLCQDRVSVADDVLDCRVSNFGLEHHALHPREFAAAAPTPPQNPFQEQPERYTSRRRLAQAKREVAYLRSRGEHHPMPEEWPGQEV